MDRSIYVVKTKALICGFVFAYAKRWFSHNAAQMSSIIKQNRTYLSTLFMLLVPLSTTRSTSPVFLPTCHLKERLKQNTSNFQCIKLQESITLAARRLAEQYQTLYRGQGSLICSIKTKHEPFKQSHSTTNKLFPPVKRYDKLVLWVESLYSE